LMSRASVCLWGGIRMAEHSAPCQPRVSRTFAMKAWSKRFNEELKELNLARRDLEKRLRAENNRIKVLTI
jgi:hypothetical protein